MKAITIDGLLHDAKAERGKLVLQVEGKGQAYIIRLSQIDQENYEQLQDALDDVNRGGLPSGKQPSMAQLGYAILIKAGKYGLTKREWAQQTREVGYDPSRNGITFDRFLKTFNSKCIKKLLDKGKVEAFRMKKEIRYRLATF